MLRHPPPSLPPSLPPSSQPAEAFTARTLLTAFLSAIIHDYDHRGVNNDFLVRTADPLALMYNDTSPQVNGYKCNC